MRTEDYLELPYKISLTKEPPVEGNQPIWFAEVEDLPGCTSHGHSPEDAVESVREAMKLWIEVALEDGTPIPKPRTEDEHSGRFIVRSPRSLHARLVREAQREGTSLNQFVTNALSGAVGWRSKRETLYDDLVEVPVETAFLELRPSQYREIGRMKDKVQLELKGTRIIGLQSEEQAEESS
jgi:antitoxin HicB